MITALGSIVCHVPDNTNPIKKMPSAMDAKANVCFIKVQYFLGRG